MAPQDYDAQALKALVDAELELSALVLERASRAKGRERQHLIGLADEIGSQLDVHIPQFEQAWLRRSRR